MLEAENPSWLNPLLAMVISKLSCVVAGTGVRAEALGCSLAQ